MSRPDDLLRAALTYAARGWAVFPCLPGSKHPAIEGGFKAATHDQAQVHEWWRQKPQANVAIATGDASGFWVLDIDEADGKGGSRTLGRLVEQYGPLPETVQQITPTGGRHLLFRLNGIPVRNSAQKLGAGLDTRGTGGYIIAPPSLHPNGGIYTWCAEHHPADMRPADAPRWLYELLDKPKSAAGSGDDHPFSDAYVRAAVESELGRVINASQGERNDALNKASFALGQLVGAGALDRADIAARLLRAALAAGLEDSEARKTIESGLSAGEKQPREMPDRKPGRRPRHADAVREDDPNDSRPLIRVRAGLLHQLATEAECALIAADAPLYVRGGAIVRPVVEEVEAARGRRTTIARLTEVTPDGLTDWLSRSVRWARFDARADAWVSCDPPRPVAATVLARDGEWKFPGLAGVITTPTLRPDGSVLATPGFDPATRLLLMQPPKIPAIPDRPSKDLAAAALGHLDGLLNDFPFVDDASRSVALSSLITPIVRGAFAVAPLHAKRAPAPGSGKSYLVDIASAIATGQRCPVIAAGRTEEETEKRLASALLAGQAIVSIDNLNGELFGDALCQMVERPVVRIRPLGRSELVQIENRVTLYATGNNLQPSGDMVRRIVLCSLDPNMERPELRRFSGDPLGAVLTDRGPYIAAALCIVRAYIVAGTPNPCPPIASFEDWSLLVRSALVWLGCTDPADTMEAARDEDPETTALRDAVSAWKAAIGLEKPLSAGELVAEAEAQHWVSETGEYHDKGRSEYKHPQLRAAFLMVANDGRAISPVRLGKWLGRKKGRVIDGLKIVGRTDGHQKSTKWALSR